MESKRVVHVIDDEETIRKAVGFTLRTAGFAVETYGSGVDFLKIADEAERGSIVLDMHMPDMNGLQVQAALTQMDISMPVVMLTGNGDIALAVQAMKAGAVDFLAKPIERALLLDAIDRAFARIDTAEGRALEGLAQGLPNKTIAYDLGISSRTVEVHRASIMSKLGVRTLAETLRIAFAAGMGRPL